MSYQNSARWYREAEHVDMYKDDIYGMYEDGFFYDYEYDDDAPASEDEHEHSCNGSQASDEHEERHSDTNDEVAEEQSAFANDSASTDIQHEHHHHTSTLSEPESNANVENSEWIGTVVVEDKAQLLKTIRDGINRCNQGIEHSRTKWTDEIQDANRSFNDENELMNEWHERIKTQELILNKRTEIHVRLPTNHVVTPAHNALVEEDAKEGLLIAELFKAVKTEKADLRAKLESRLEKAEEVHRSECAALSKQIACLRKIAELSAIDLDDMELEDYSMYESVAPVTRIQSSTPAQSASYTREPVFNNARSKSSNTANTDRHQRFGASGKGKEDDCTNCSRLQAELSATRKSMARVQAGAPIPDLRKFIKHGEQILSELEKQRDALDGVAAKEHHNEMRTADAALEKLAIQHARIKNIYIGIGHLWEHENEDVWSKTYAMCRKELDLIKEEEKAIENRSFRCEEKVHKRQCDYAELLTKQIKFYTSMLSLARSEVANRWGYVDLPGSESDDDTGSDSE